MRKNGNILIVDDNRGVLTALQLLLRPHFDEIRTLTSPVTLPSVLREQAWSVLLLDMNFTSGINNGNEGFYWLHEAHRLCPALPVVLFTAYGDIELAVRGIQEGAANFIVKPWDNQKLVDTLIAAARPVKKKSEENRGLEVLEGNAQIAGMYWGKSAAMQRLRALVEKVATTDANVLITGENGTGKEMLARELHRLSRRSDRGMVTVDMGAVSESLFESELFGHVKGSFTDAHADRAGKFEAADKSTLFLDEIANLPYHLQAKLLTVLQRRSVVRIGSNQEIPVNIRLICATNHDIVEDVAQEKFREDLFYRINTIHLELPPLRERPEDILPLAERFVAAFARKYGSPCQRLSADAEKLLLSHSWPGNIRELEHAVEKAVIICDEAEISGTLFSFPQRTESQKPVQFSTLEAMERTMITQAIDEEKGNLSAVAARLGISRQTLYNKMKKFGI